MTATAFGDVLALVRTDPKANLAAQFLNGRLTPDGFRGALRGLDTYDRADVIRSVDGLALLLPRPLTADQVACLEWLEAPPAPPVTDTGDVDPGQIDSAQYFG